MQSKGFIRVLAVLLALVCVFYLSFSFVTSSIEDDAAAYAAKIDNNPESQKYKDAYKLYLDSVGHEKVYLGYTYNEAFSARFPKRIPTLSSTRLSLWLKRARTKILSVHSALNTSDFPRMAVLHRFSALSNV